MRRIFAVVFALSVACAPTSLVAQSTTGTITGTVRDSSGAAVVGARVQVKSTARNQVLTTVTTEAGSYTVPSLIPGAYEASVTAQGFERQNVTGIEVQTAQITTQNFSLTVGQVSETVSVVAETPMINPNSSAVTTNVSNKLLQEIPFTDNSTLSAVLLTPGAQGDPQYSGGVQSELPGIFTQAIAPGAALSIGGGIPGAGSILVDGSDITSAGTGRATMTFSRDSVQEITIQANGIPAQYGRTSSAIINQASKSGSNELHGQFTWSHLDPGLETRILGSSFPPTEHYNSFTGAIGGPVVIPKLYNGRNRTFFWATGEPQRLKLFFGASRTRLPTAAELAGNFNDSYDLLDPTLRQQNIDAAIASPLRSNSLRYHQALNAQGFPVGPLLATADRPVIPGNSVAAQLAANPLAQKLLKALYPLTPGVDTPYVHWLRPNGLPEADGNNAIFARGTDTIDNRWSVKIDHIISDKDRLSIRYSDAPVTGTRFDWAGPGDPSDPIAQDDFQSKNVAGSETHIFSSHAVNEFRATYSRGDGLRSPNNAALSRDWGAELGLVPAVAGAGFPSILSRGLNPSGGINGRSLDENLGFGDDFSYISGAHSFKFGGEHRRIMLNRVDYGGLYGGAYNFSGAISPNTGSINGLIDQIGGLILGAVNTYTYNSKAGSADYLWKYFAAYAQDDWKLSPKLTLNIGLRWDVETPRQEANNQQGSFIPSLQGTVNGTPVQGAFVFAGHNGRSKYLWPINFNGWQPRIGLSYAARPWMVWRASYALIKTPLTGLGNEIDPNPNVNANSVNSSQGTGGVNPGPVNLITNPIAALAPAQSLGFDPIFSMNNANAFSFNYIPQNNAVPTLQKWYAGVQLQLRRSFALEIGYNGAKGTHLFGLPYQFNSAPIASVGALVASGADFSTTSTVYNQLGLTNSNGSLIAGNLLQSLRPYPQFFNTTILTRYDRSANSIYHALNVGLNKRFASGLQWQAAYSFSKSIDDGATNYQASGTSDIYGTISMQSPNRRLERSVSVFDTPHRFTTAFSYELPFGPGKPFAGARNGFNRLVASGWNLSGYLMAQSGYPTNAYAGSAGWFQSSGGGSALDYFTLRADRVPGVPVINPNWESSPFTQPYLNSAAFAIPGNGAAPSLGNAPRTLGDARSPGILGFDTSVYKNIPLGKEDRVRIQLRVDILNVLNHPNLFINPNSSRSVADGAYVFNATTRVFTPNVNFSTLDPNNTGQWGNYAGRQWRVGARVSF